MSEQHEVTLIDRLSQTYGNSLEMTDESGKSRVFDLLAEFEMSDKAYAVVQAVDGDEDADVLRITEDAAGGWQLETIESDEEWEDAMEQFDELAYSEELDG